MQLLTLNQFQYNHFLPDGTFGATLDQKSPQKAISIRQLLTLRTLKLKASAQRRLEWMHMLRHYAFCAIIISPSYITYYIAIINVNEKNMKGPMESKVSLQANFTVQNLWKWEHTALIVFFVTHHLFFSA